MNLYNVGDSPLLRVEWLSWQGVLTPCRHTHIHNLIKEKKSTVSNKWPNLVGKEITPRVSTAGGILSWLCTWLEDTWSELVFRLWLGQVRRWQSALWRRRRWCGVSGLHFLWGRVIASLLRQKSREYYCPPEPVSRWPWWPSSSLFLQGWPSWQSVHVSPGDATSLLLSYISLQHFTEDFILN